MSEQPSGRRGGRGTVMLIAVIAFVLLAEAALVVTVFISPSTSKKLEQVAASADRAWNGTDDELGLRTRMARAAQGAYEDWVAPLWRGPRPSEAGPEFTTCVGCHPTYASQRQFGVYMNHPLHAEIGVACVTCHPQSPHPNPPRPQEAVCAECHEEVQQGESCDFCHPPGSLPHFYLLGAPRSSSVRCDVCHPKGAFGSGARDPQIDMGVFSGADEQTCFSCHRDISCERCHAEPHSAAFVSTHGSSVGYGGATDCINCHTTPWCADRCHAVTQTNPFVPRPLPPVGVRP